MMATGYMPRRAGEGQVGSASKPWDAVVANNLVTRLNGALVDVAETFATAESVAALASATGGEAGVIQDRLATLQAAVDALTVVVDGKQAVDGRLTGLLNAELGAHQLVCTAVDDQSFTGLTVSDYVATLLAAEDAQAARATLDAAAADHGEHLPSRPDDPGDFVLGTNGWVSTTAAALTVGQLAGLVTGDGCSPLSRGAGSLGTEDLPWGVVAAERLLVANAAGEVVDLMSLIVSSDVTNALSARLSGIEENIQIVSELTDNLGGLQESTPYLAALSVLPVVSWQFPYIGEDMVAATAPISELTVNLMGLNSVEWWREALDVPMVDHGNHVPDPPDFVDEGEQFFLNQFNTFQMLTNETVGAPKVDGTGAYGTWTIEAVMAEHDHLGNKIDETYTRNSDNSQLGHSVTMNRNKDGQLFTMDVLYLSVDEDEFGTSVASLEIESTGAIYMTAGGTEELEYVGENYDDLGMPNDIHGINLLGNTISLVTPGGYVMVDHDGTLVPSNGFRGDLLGNADTASRLAAARSIAITGAVTGDPVVFDGSADVVLHARSCVAERVATSIDDAQELDAVRVVANESGDGARLRIGGEADALCAELATTGDGNESVYVRQYTGSFGAVAHSATLLDGSGNTVFPGTVTAAKFHGVYDLVSAPTAKQLLVGSNDGVLGVDPDVYLTTTSGQLRATSFDSTSVSTGTLTADTKISVQSTVADSTGLRSNRIDVLDASPVIAFHYDGSSSATTTLTATSASLLTCSTEFTATKCHNAVWNDYAEFFERGEGDVRPGDLVALADDGAGGEVYVRASADSAVVVGVCSDEYGHVVGGLPAEPGKTVAETNAGKFVAVALAGRVWTSVRGPVHVGDQIVPSDEPGVGVATVEHVRRSVGTALTAKADAGVGKVRVLVNR